MQEKEKEGLFLHWCQDAILGNLLLRNSFFKILFCYTKNVFFYKWHIIMKVPLKGLFLNYTENYTFKVSLRQTSKNSQWRTLEIISKDIQNSFQKHSTDFQKVKQNCRFGRK